LVHLIIVPLDQENVSGTHNPQPELQTLAEETQKLSEHKTQKLSKLTGAKGDLGKVERCFLQMENTLAFGHTSASDFALKASSDDASSDDSSSDDTNKTVDAECMFERKVRPYSKTAIKTEVWFFRLDMFTDLLQIHNLYWNRCHAFGGVMLSLFIWVLTVQLVRGDICTLTREVEEIASHGVKTMTYMKIMRWEKGFESFLNLMFTAYAIHFSITTATNLITGFAGLFFSIGGFVVYIFHKGYLMSKYDEATAQHV